jgi:hypothetical protein
LILTFSLRVTTLEGSSSALEADSFGINNRSSANPASKARLRTNQKGWCMNIFRLRLIVALTLGIFAGHRNVTSAQQVHAHDHEAMEKNIREALAGLSPEDRELAAAQRFCPIHVYRRLGSTGGTPIKVATTGKPIFVCSRECVEEVVKGGAAIKRIASGLRKSTARLAKLSPEERAAAEAQKYCPIMSSRLLGTMGAPIKLVLNGKPVYVCCPDCVADAEANPAETLAQAAKLRRKQVVVKDKHHDHKHDHDKHHEHGAQQPEK